MSDSAGFQALLGEALGAKRQFLIENSLSQLKEGFRIFQSLFENLYNILLRKALVQEDPYKYEQKITEIIIPAKGDILDSEKSEKLSQRLSAFHAQLEFLNTYYQFSLEFLNLQRIRRIMALVQYINWAHVGENSPDATTSVLAETLAKIRPGSDNVSTGIISTSLIQLQKQHRSILAQLKEILDFQRQAYKLMLREQLLPSLGQSLGKLYEAGEAKAYDKLKSVFASTMKSKPFFRDLVMELLQEEFSTESATLRQQSLDVLKIRRQEEAEVRAKPDYKVILIEAVRLMLPAAGHLLDVLRKIVSNQQLLEKSRRGVGGKFRSWLQKTFQRRETGQTIDIRYFDNRTSSTHSETIDFQKFVESIRRKISLFDALGQPDSVSFARLGDAAEQQIDGFLRKNIGELQLLHRRLQGLAEFFREEAPTELQSQLKGTKIELSGLKNCIVRTNRRRYEYVALKEEEVRLQEMGVPGSGVAQQRTAGSGVAQRRTAGSGVAQRRTAGQRGTPSSE
jgi:hypothetical protein